MCVMLFLPLLLVFAPSVIPGSVTTLFYTISLVAVFFVMAIRPLADIMPRASWLRALVILRKGFGVLSASLIMVFVFQKIIQSGGAYFASILTPAYWSLTKYAVLAHLGDLSAVPLLITSNKYSKRVLGPWWKRLQKLAYVYFYAGALYELLALHSMLALVALVIVTMLVLIASVKNRGRLRVQQQQLIQQTV
jgi:DMSO/TMAO reductase YedYZ heme-binding membrane subunit